MRPLQYISQALVAEKHDRSHCHAALLAGRAVVRVAGADAAKLLQGLITNDIDKARDGTAIHAGLLTPQGKILFDFFVVPFEDGFLLEVAAGQAADLVKRLGFYKLRANVEIKEEPSFAVGAAWGGRPHAPPDSILYADPRFAELGSRLLLPAPASLAVLGCERVSEADYHAMRIGLGVPEGGRTMLTAMPFPMRPYSTSSIASTSARAASSVRRWCRAWSTGARRGNASSRSKAQVGCPRLVRASRPAQSRSAHLAR